jgi:predicted lipoprotein with Yx(FWY)xxD motif
MAHYPGAFGNGAEAPGRSPTNGGMSMSRVICSPSSPTRRRLTRTAMIAGVLAGGVSLAACGGGSAKPASTAKPISAGFAAGAAPTVRVGSTRIGTVVVDSTGRTLYTYDLDHRGSGTSACNAGCAQAWPPDLVSGQPTVGTGVRGNLGVITRSDGSHQLTLDGQPLYRYAGDSGPGDTSGDGLGGIWHLVPASTNG